MCSDEEDSAESTTDEDNMEDNTSQDAADERWLITVTHHCVLHSLVVHVNPAPTVLISRAVFDVVVLCGKSTKHITHCVCPGVNW